MDLKTINEQPDGFCPPELTAKIAKVWDRKSGTNETGDWSFQNIDVEHGGIKATLKLKNLPEFPTTRVGQIVTIRAHKSDTHGLTGIKTETREYNGKSYKSIVITPSGKWEWGAAQTNGNSATHAAPVAQNGALDATAYTDHLLSCAELANVVTAKLLIEDAQAVQACFATICIDTKNRNLLLPKPKTLEVESSKLPGEQGDPFEDTPPPAEFDEDDIPF